MRFGSDLAFQWSLIASESFDEHRNGKGSGDGGAAEACVVALCGLEAYEQGKVVGDDR